MDYKFDAFISYRHAEVDSAVAKDIPHWLEHFHGPIVIHNTSRVSCHRKDSLTMLGTSPI